MRVPLLTEPDAAARLGIKPEALRHLRRTGQIGHVRLGSRMVRYRESDIDDYIATNAVRPLSAVPQRRRA